MIDTPEGPIRFVDTAGMRRKSRTEGGTEYFAMVRALDALDHADVVLLVIDATDGVTHQDQRLAERIGASGSPVVVILNKWELVATEDRHDILADVDDRLAFLGDSPVVKVSAQTGLGVHKILPALAAAVEAYHPRIPTGELNRAIRSIQVAHPPVGARIRYAVQGAIDPPTFTLFATRACRPPTSATWSASSASSSASDRRPSRSGCGPRAPTGVGVAGDDRVGPGSLSGAVV